MLFKCYVSIILLTELSCCSSLLYSIVFYYEDCCQHFHHRNLDGNSNVKFIYQKRFVDNGIHHPMRHSTCIYLAKNPAAGILASTEKGILLQMARHIHCTKEAVLT